MRVRTVGIVCALVLALTGIGACSPAPTASLDGPVYTSVAALSDDSDVVAVGEFVELSRTVHEADLYDGDGGFVEGDEGMDLDLWAFRVDEVLTGDAGLVGTTIEVTQMSDRSTEDAIYSAVGGRTSVVFLLAYDNGYSYGVVGLGAGSLEVDGEALTAPEGADPALAQDVANLRGLQGLRESLL